MKKVLIIGGTGLIGRKITALAAEKGYECTLLTRGIRGESAPDGIESLTCDRNDAEALKKVLSKKYFDVVVDQTCFNVEQARCFLDAAGANIGQLVFTSTCCVYSRPVGSLPITEEHEANPPEDFEYGYNKRLVEKYLLENMHKGGPKVTIIRPSLTFGEGSMILGFFCDDYSLIHRMQNCKPIVCPGSGQSLWTITYTGDIATGYVGAFGNEKTYGQIYHLTTDEYHTWEEIFRIVAKCANAPEPDLVYISGQTLARMVKNWRTELIFRDKQDSAIFDNSKAKRDIPAFKTNTSFEEGVRKTLAWFEEAPERKKVNTYTNYMEDRICEVYRQAELDMAAKLTEFTGK